MLRLNLEKMLQQLPIFISNLEPDTIREQFSGICFVGDDIIIDSDGYAEWKEEQRLFIKKSSTSFAEGRFIAFIREGNRWICKTDFFGQETLFYYNDGSSWAVSNSLIYLAEKLTYHNIKLDLYKPALQSFMVSNQSLFGGQLLSHRTPFEQIRMLPINQELHIRKRFNTYRMSTSGYRYSQIDIKGQKDYERYLGHYIEQWSNRLDALTDSAFSSKTIELSGGYDTRVNLALLLNSSGALRDMNISSIKSLEADYKAASRLTKELGLKIGNTRTVESNISDPGEMFSIWKYGNSGFYAPIYTVRSNHHVDALKIHGANYRGRSYVNNDAPKRASIMEDQVQGEVGKIVSQEFKNSFDEIGVDINNPNAIDKHYTAFRCRLHYGRNWFWRFRDFYVTPQLSPLYKELNDFRSYTANNSEQTTCDILVNTDERLATLPFDTAEKEFSNESIEKARSLNIESPQRKRIGIYGKPLVNNNTKDESETSDNNKEAFKELVRRHYYDAVKRPEMKEIFGSSFIEMANDEIGLERLPSSGKISVIISAAITLDIIETQ